jgi:hypothetical protein
MRIPGLPSSSPSTHDERKSEKGQQLSFVAQIFQQKVTLRGSTFSVREIYYDPANRSLFILTLKTIFRDHASSFLANRKANVKFIVTLINDESVVKFRVHFLTTKTAGYAVNTTNTVLKILNRPPIKFLKSINPFFKLYKRFRFLANGDEILKPKELFKHFQVWLKLLYSLGSLTSLSTEILTRNQIVKMGYIAAGLGPSYNPLNSRILIYRKHLALPTMVLHRILKICSFSSASRKWYKSNSQTKKNELVDIRLDFFRSTITISCEVIKCGIFYKLIPSRVKGITPYLKLTDLAVTVFQIYYKYKYSEEKPNTVEL